MFQLPRHRLRRCTWYHACGFFELLLQLSYARLFCKQRCTQPIDLCLQVACCIPTRPFRRHEIHDKKRESHGKPTVAAGS